MIDSAIYDRIYAGIARSVVYREAIAMLDLPDWIVPLSCVNRSELQRIADELRVGPGDRFVDLACGLGGSGLWVAERTGATVTGVDFSAVAVEEAIADHN